MNENLKILLLAGNTLRAKAYAQYLAKINIGIQIEGLFYGFNDNPGFVPILDNITQSYLKRNELFIPDFDESLATTFNKNNWNFIESSNTDVNSKEILDIINGIDCDIVVFAGYGGQLLKKNHFTSKKKYLHMHPGKLPLERGSTTLYYSILNERDLTVTSFYMSEKIDAGINVLFCNYPVPDKDVDIDCWVDNIIRADCFLKALNKINSKTPLLDKDKNQSNEYYIIHPVLKHIALLSLKEF